MFSAFFYLLLRACLISFHGEGRAFAQNLPPNITNPVAFQPLSKQPANMSSMDRILLRLLEGADEVHHDEDEFEHHDEDHDDDKPWGDAIAASLLIQMV